VDGIWKVEILSGENKKEKVVNLHLNGFVPVHDVSRQLERVDIDDMNISSFCPDVNPLAL